ncbi:ribosomal protein RPL7 [Besnoitia besnoiti]|uniref:Ribosomal protein RPL7 n=1 Tax=Besnoitia besnoiti TaxID=94643 RepID=A0A2A9MDQ0_BESBE|nr:ribosomal protein RPL7 [Besnoitia besnoiti]PFH34391.1 ribosomal protein RPL7 [Besnoitia besnoiti]
MEGAPVAERTKVKIARDEKLLEKMKKAKEVRVKKLREQRHALKLRTYKYVSEYRKEKENLIKLKREAKAQGGFYKEPEAKVILATRIKGINKLAPKPKMILRLFRLRQLHNAVFIKVNKATIEMLKAVQPFITYGYPSLKTIRQLVYKRGYAKVGKPGAHSRVRLQCNDIISENLGKYGIHGIEDLVHEIYTCGPYFKQANNFLWPFKLSSPRKGFTSKRHGYNEPRKGDWGNREEMINELVQRMI